MLTTKTTWIRVSILALPVYGLLAFSSTLGPQPEQRHPKNDPAVFREYARGDIWTADHLGEYFDFTAKACAMGSRHNEVEYGRRRSL